MILAASERSQAECHRRNARSTYNEKQYETYVTALVSVLKQQCVIRKVPPLEAARLVFNMLVAEKQNPDQSRKHLKKMLLKTPDKNLKINLQAAALDLEDLQVVNN